MSMAWRAPVCVAKGLDAVALRIRAVAEENGVPVVENPPLARALYKAVDLDQDIPVEHYKAVAEVIGYVMRSAPEGVDDGRRTDPELANRTGTGRDEHARGRRASTGRRDPAAPGSCSCSRACSWARRSRYRCWPARRPSR